MINPMDLSGKHIVVTGASSGIGEEVARQVSRLGGRVSLIARNEEKLARVLESLDGLGHLAFVADLSNPASVEPAVHAAFRGGGCIYGAVYCAGVNDTRPLRSVKPDKLNAVMAVNFASFVEFCRCVSMSSYRAETMSIVGVSSVNSKIGSAGKTAYCASKSAMNGAMRAMAHELASSGVRVNNVLPGWVDTGMFASTVEMLGRDNVAKEFEMLQYIGHPLAPVDVANAVAFLLSDASTGMTGSELVVGGGYLS